MQDPTENLLEVIYEGITPRPELFRTRDPLKLMSFFPLKGRHRLVERVVCSDQKRFLPCEEVSSAMGDLPKWTII
jgi:hypothetical protein